MTNDQNGSPGHGSGSPVGPWSLVIGHSAQRAAVFLDRDGVLNRSVVREGKPFPPATVAEFELYPDAATSCERLAAAGFALVVVTNQPDVGRGTQSLAVVEAMHARLRTEIPQIVRVEVCPHGGTDHGQPCECRKPQPGMILRAASGLSLDLTQSWMVGDRWRDVDCGHAAGCRTVFIERGYDEPLRQAPEFRVTSLSQAAEVIVEQAAGRAADPKAAAVVLATRSPAAA